MITNAAINYHGLVLTGKRHDKIMKRIIKDTGIYQGDRITSVMQGFMNDKGCFLTRYEATEEAKACGQIKGDFIGVLTSESLW